MAESSVLVAGASGHVGSKLVPRLVATGRRVLALSRQERSAGDGVQAVLGDVLDRDSLDRAFAGVESAYYLVHGLADTSDLEEVELGGARTFAAAASAAGVGRIVYLGGLAHGDDLSPHLEARRQV
ncbi:MAG: NAD(P)H-binding protein, partial [Actinomycetota bacterium]|nr:NAD(P)H-binding protein [Actinomycetota bacterium]